MISSLFRQETSFEDDYTNREGIVKAVLKSGSELKIFMDGTYWKARPAKSHYIFSPGDLVKSVARKGLTLMIEPT